jgi:hypothetical protein
MRKPYACEIAVTTLYEQTCWTKPNASTRLAYEARGWLRTLNGERDSGREGWLKVSELSLSISWVDDWSVCRPWFRGGEGSAGTSDRFYLHSLFIGRQTLSPQRNMCKTLLRPPYKPRNLSKLSEIPARHRHRHRR